MSGRHHLTMEHGHYAYITLYDHVANEAFRLASSPEQIKSILK